MEIAEAKEFIKHNHHGVLVARKKDGTSLQMTLVTPVLGADGQVTITARGNTFKVKNIRRNPNVSLLVFGDKFNGSGYIQVDGKAQVIDHPDAMPIVLDWIKQIRGEPKDLEETKQKTLGENRIAIRLTVERCGPQATSHGNR